MDTDDIIELKKRLEDLFVYLSHLGDCRETGSMLEEVWRQRSATVRFAILQIKKKINEAENGLHLST